MRESIGSSVLYNIVILFLSIIFALIIGTLVYYKAYKVNKTMIAVIEKYEGWNDYSKSEVAVQLKSIGYPARDLGFCPTKDGKTSLTNSNNTNKYNYPICIYYVKKDSHHYYYGVLSYITIDVPFLDGRTFKYSVYSKTSTIYKFGGGAA